MRTIHRPDLSALHDKLLKAAREASSVAHCDYSGYPVGAALLLRTPGGEVIVTGNNYETLTYRSVCAEKHALLRAFADHSRLEPDGTIIRPDVLAVAVYCARGAAPQQPCGDCRQALHEINPDMQVISAAGAGQEGGPHDSRVTITTVGELLPFGFAVESLRGQIDGVDLAIAEEDDVADFVVHLPRPEMLRADAARRSALLEGVDHMIVVGSPRRARRIAQMAHAEFGAPPAADACYCDLTEDGRDETGREYALYAFAVGGSKVVVASHGVGKAGIEVIMSEVPALVHLIQGEPARIAGALRCGTRGTLAQLPLGCVALSTSCVNEHLDRLDPDPEWVGRLRAAGRNLGMTNVPDHQIDSVSRDHPAPTTLLTEGTGLSASFFWRGQGRPLYRAHAVDTGAYELDQRGRAVMLGKWVRAGIRYIEMEDYTLLRVGALVGIPTATLGAVIAHRRAPDGTFQLDYSKQALQASELIPARIALRAIADGVR
jgi:cytidine deaminase/uridine phosphorylase